MRQEDKVKEAIDGFVRAEASLLVAEEEQRQAQANVAARQGNVHTAEKELVRVIHSTGKTQALYGRKLYEVVDDRLEVKEFDGIIVE